MKPPHNSISKPRMSPHAWFFLLAFILLGIGSLIWAQHVRENYRAPEAKVENIVPDPFR